MGDLPAATSSLTVYNLEAGEGGAYDVNSYFLESFKWFVVNNVFKSPLPYPKK